jgi:hypothetical protein
LGIFSFESGFFGLSFFELGLAALLPGWIANFDAGCEAGVFRPVAEVAALDAVARDLAAPNVAADLGLVSGLAFSGLVLRPALGLAVPVGDVDVAGWVFRAMPHL